MDPISVGQAVASIVAPFLPYLVTLKKSVDKKLETVIEEQGGEFVFNQAKSVWTKVADWFSDDDEIISIGKLLAAAPEKQERQEELAQVLGERLKENPERADKLVEMMGGEKGVQSIIAGHHAKLTKVVQKAKAGAQQKIQLGDNAEITDSGQYQD